MNVCRLSLGLLQSGSTNARAGETNVNVNLLQQYLEGSPWIRKIVFRWPRNRTRFFIQSKNISGRVQGWARFEAALQPGGWYIKHLEGSPQYDVFGRDGVPRLGAPPRGAEEFVGANSDYYWEFGPGRPDLASMGLGPGNDLLRLIPREGRPGYSPTNYGLFRMHDERTNYLESVRLWGFYWLYLLKMKVAWTGRDTFVARAPDGSFAEGSVTHWADEQRPARWECIVRPADREPWSFRVEYEHDRSRSFPPARFIMGGAAVAGEPIRFLFDRRIRARSGSTICRRLRTRNVSFGSRLLQDSENRFQRHFVLCGLPGKLEAIESRRAHAADAAAGTSGGFQGAEVDMDSPRACRGGRLLGRNRLLAQADQNVRSGELPGPHARTPGAKVSTQSPPRPHRPNPGRSGAHLRCLSLVHCQAS